jgi:2-polyprenyl-6-methoxyphenol hydroxylase-like FAD-dependent oxidoreductase
MAGNGRNRAIVPAQPPGCTPPPRIGAWRLLWTSASAAPASSAARSRCCWPAERLRVGLVDTAPAPSHADVRAYALNAASRQLLESLRAWPDEAHATPVLGMEVRGDDGGQVRFAAADVPALAWIVDVPALEQRLGEAVRYQPQVDRARQPEPAALTVVCEGRDSATRAAFGIEDDVQPYGQVAIAARLSCEKPHGHVARQWFAGGEVLALLPMGGRRRGGNSVALVWSVRQDRRDASAAVRCRRTSRPRCRPPATTRWASSPSPARAPPGRCRSPPRGAGAAPAGCWPAMPRTACIRWPARA